MPWTDTAQETYLLDDNRKIKMLIHFAWLVESKQFDHCQNEKKSKKNSLSSLA